MKFVCEICGSVHSTMDAAAECEAQPMIGVGQNSYSAGWYDPQVGEVVECSYPASSWWEGDKDWRVYRERGGRFLDGFYALWVVVAKVHTGRDHLWKYVLWTPSHIQGREALRYTNAEHTQCYPNRMATVDEMSKARDAFEANEGLIHSI